MPDQDVAGAGAVQVHESAIPPQVLDAIKAEATEAGMIPLKINGEERSVSPQELIKMAQRGAAADQKFQEASIKMKEAEAALSLQADLRALGEDGSDDAFRRLGRASGMTEAQVEDVIAANGHRRPQESSDDEDDDVNIDGPTAVDLQNAVDQMRNRKLGFSQLTPDLQKVLVDVENNRIEQIVTKTLDNDTKMQYHMSRLGDAGKAQAMNLIRDGISRQLDNSGSQFGDGAQILPVVFEQVSGLLDAFGTSNGTTPSIGGLGPAPGGSGAEVHRKEPPPYVSSANMPDFEDHITKQIAYNANKLR